MVAGPEGEWVGETIHDGLGFRTSLLATRFLVRHRTPLQDLAIFETPIFGRVMMLDGAVQLTTADEYVYHEMMAHVPLFAHGAAQRVLVIGGGDGGVAREVLRHASVSHVTLVEIDPDVVALAREHFPEVSAGAVEDPRLDLVIADGVAYVAGTADRFDVVIVDSTDPGGPSEVLFTESFYRDCRRALRPGGVLVTQSGMPVLQRAELVEGVRNLAATFCDVACFLSVVPSYTGGFMAHGFASDDPGRTGIAQEALAARVAASGLSFRYYSPAVHRAAFALPPFIAEAVDEGRGR